MTSQRRTIMGACEYSIASLQNLKKGLMDTSAPNIELNWAIGGIVATLVSNLIQLCDEVFNEALQTGEANAQQDIWEIKERFTHFVERMVNDAQ